VPHFHRV